MRTSVHKEKQRGFSQKGMSFTELIVVIGMTVLLTSIGYVTYRYYFHVTGKLNALYQVGAHVLQRMQICSEESVLNMGAENLLPVDRNTDGDTTDPEDWKGCNSKARLGLVDCEECEEPLTDGNLICVTIKTGKFSLCVNYQVGHNMYHHFKTTVNQKACVHSRGLTTIACTADSDCGPDSRCTTISGGVSLCEDLIGRTVAWPIVLCDEDTDCEPGLYCLDSHGKCGVRSPTDAKCL